MFREICGYYGNGSITLIRISQAPGYELVPFSAVSKIGIENEPGFRKIFFYQDKETSLIVMAPKQKGFPCLYVQSWFDIISHLEEIYKPLHLSLVRNDELALGITGGKFSEMWKVERK